MKKIKILLIILFASLVGCEEWVTSVDPFNTVVYDDGLNKEEYIDALIIGIENNVNFAVDDLFMNADGLSDQLIFDRRNANATFSGLEGLDKGQPIDTDGEIVQPYDNIHEFRLLADTLLYRVNNKITFANQANKNKGLFSGYFWGAYSRYLLASYYGKSETVGGATVSLSPFIPSATLYQHAITRFKEALKYTTDAYKIKLTNSMLGRVYFMIGDFANAYTYVNTGLKKGDAPLVAKYNLENANDYRVGAGDTRTQFSLDPRFDAIATADPTEKNRLKYAKLTGSGGFIFWSQRKYIQNADQTLTPIEIIDWQENNLMLAELILRGAGAGNALALVNEVRTNSAVSALSNSTVLSVKPEAGKYSIYEERDKALWCRGNRLLDQRRLGLFHVPGGWQYSPIPRNEKQKNPNWVD